MSSHCLFCSPPLQHTLTLGSVYAWGMGTNLQLGTGEEEDEWSPVKMTGKQLENCEVLLASSGGQHTALLVKDKQESWCASDTRMGIVLVIIAVGGHVQDAQIEYWEFFRLSVLKESDVQDAEEVRPGLLAELLCS